MKLFFISKIPAFLKINGEFAGKIKENLRCYEFFNEDIHFLEIIPCDSNYEVIYTDLTNKANVKIYDFLGEKLIVPKFLRKRNLKYQIVCQRFFNLNNYENLISVITDGCIKFYLDGGLTLTDELPFIPTNVDAKIINNCLFLSFHAKKTCLFIYLLANNQTTLIFKDVIDNFFFDDYLTIKKQILFPFNSLITEKWELKNNKFTLIDISLNGNIFYQNLNKKILPLYFFELFKYGIVCNDLLDENLKEKRSQLLDFIKIPNFVFSHPYDINKVCVITENSLNVYSLIFKNNLITNILED